MVDDFLELPEAIWEYPFTNKSPKEIAVRLRSLFAVGRKLEEAWEETARVAMLVYMEYYYEFGDYDPEDLLYVWEWLCEFDNKVPDYLSYGYNLVRSGGGVPRVEEIMLDYFALVSEEHKRKIPPEMVNAIELSECCGSLVA